MRSVVLILLLHVGRAAATAAPSVFVWHITDVHVDPWYTVGSDADGCYCESSAAWAPAACPRMGPSCNMKKANGSTAAAVWGNSEGNCATPFGLYKSAVAFMGETKRTPLVYFTGDFAEAGAVSPCHGDETTTAQRQILDIITWDWKTLQASLPSAKIFGSLGNHDSVPGDVYYGMNDDGNGAQSWEYNNLTTLWGGDIGEERAGLSTLKRGGYYATRPTMGLTVISLNINYWVKQNSEMNKANSSAQLEGARMMKWFAAELASAHASGDAVHVLGHQPPTGGAWHAGYWPQYTALCAEYKDVIKGQFYGHIHVDQWTLTRDCRNDTAPVPKPDSAGYYVTKGGISWCSGNGDWTPPPAVVEAFNSSLDGRSLLVPAGWSADYAAMRCEAACTGNTTCVGFTLYMVGKTEVPHECTFRAGAGGTRNKPPSAGATTRCYEKASDAKQPAREMVCDGVASTVLLPGPSLTEGFPATNPSLRLLEFDAESFELLDAHTYTADLHAANRKAAARGGGGGGDAADLDWQLEYSFKAQFGLDDMGVGSFEALAHRLASDSSTNGNTQWVCSVCRVGGFQTTIITALLSPSIASCLSFD